MKLTDLIAARTYRLTADVPNPNRDRRATDDAPRLLFTTGDHWRVELQWYPDREDKGTHYVSVQLRPRRIAASRYSPKGALLLGWVWYRANDNEERFNEHSPGPVVRSLLADESTFYDGKPWVQRFLDALELVPEDFADLLVSIEGEHYDLAYPAFALLKELYLMGRVTREDLIAARDARNQRAAAEEAAEKAAKAAGGAP